MSTITTIHRAYKVKLYPSQEQQRLFWQHIAFVCKSYNYGLEQILTALCTDTKVPNWMAIKKQWNAEKRTLYPWVDELTQRTSEFALMNLGVAYQRFWKLRKENGRQMRNKPIKNALHGLQQEIGFPRFKSIRRYRSFQLWDCPVRNSRIKLGKIGWVKYRERDYIPTDGIKFNRWTVSYRGGEWWASCQVEQPHTTTSSTGPIIGIDVGLNTRAVAATSDGSFVKFYTIPKLFRYAEKRHKRLCRKRSRQQYQSKSWQKTNRRIQRIETHIANKRCHLLNQITSDIVGRKFPPNERPSIIVIEHLNIKGMMQNHNLARSVADASMSELHRQLQYKAAWCGVKVIIADMWFPSSQICPSCGTIRKKELSERIHHCKDCGFTVDRDAAAAMSLAHYGEKLCYLEVSGEVKPVDSVDFGPPLVVVESPG